MVALFICQDLWTDARRAVLFCTDNIVTVPGGGYINDIGDGGDGDDVNEYYGDFNENEGSLI